MMKVMGASAWMKLSPRVWLHDNATKMSKAVSGLDMKPAIILLLSLVVITACNHQYNNPLEGSWQLTEVYDKTTGTSSYPPKINGKAIVLTITTSGFHGKTFNNVFTGDSYQLTGEDGITFGNFMGTLVVEDTWGSAFMTVLGSCMLQSVRPCTPSKYTISGPFLIIQSPLRYTLRFKRI